MGTACAIIVRVPYQSLPLKTPEIKRLTMNATELGATALMIDPSSNPAMDIRQTVLTGKTVYS